MLILFQFEKGATLALRLREINSIFGEKTVSKSGVPRYYIQFLAGNYNLEGEERVDRVDKLNNPLLVIRKLENYN